MDVGGGYSDKGLADEALMWMVEKARATGLVIDDEYLIQVAKPDYAAPLHESRKFPYTIIPAYWRPLGAGIPPTLAVYSGQSNEVLGKATVLRYNEIPTYRPKNLVEYFEGQG